jgi:hypothetical protein
MVFRQTFLSNCHSSFAYPKRKRSFWLLGIRKKENREKGDDQGFACIG